MLPSRASISVNLDSISVRVQLRWYAEEEPEPLTLWYRSGNSKDKSQNGSTVLDLCLQDRHVTLVPQGREAQM